MELRTLRWTLAREPIAALSHGVQLAISDQDQYIGLHDLGWAAELEFRGAGRFVVERIGEENSASFADIGIEYYRDVD